jgi:arginine/lysine/ornithine decarboxylase
VQSVHKTLPGLTGAAVLHLRDESDHDRALRILRREQTSSPSFVLLMSIDDARAYMEERGRVNLQATADAADALRRELPALGYRDAHEAWRDTGLAFDRTRLVIEAPQGGAKLAAQLREHGIDVEMNDLRRVVLILSAMDSPEDIGKVADALRAIPADATEIPCLAELTGLPEQAMEVRSAAMAESILVPLTECEGRIAAVSAGLYPPGIPLVCPGERMTAEIAGRLLNARNQERFGVEGDALLCVNV